MNIISWNVNGIRAVERKGELLSFLAAHDPDIFLIQEIKAQDHQLSAFLRYHPEYFQYYHSAKKPGYSGTGIWVKKQLPLQDLRFETGMTDFDDTEGRIASIRFSKQDKTYAIFGVYFPNGGKSPEAWEGKLVFYKKFLDHINSLRSQGIECIWAGDVNCAHNPIDLARPEDNDGQIGFHPLERAWLDDVVQNDWVDIWRQTNPDTKDVYSWWHQITRARDRNVGWRIDYFFCDQTFFDNIQNISYLTDQMGSDHCPVEVRCKV